MATSATETTTRELVSAIQEIQNAVYLASKAASNSANCKGSAWVAIAGNRAEVQVSLSGVFYVVEANAESGLERKTFWSHDAKECALYMGATL